MLAFQVTTQAFPSWNSLRQEGLHVILHVLKENYKHHIADFRVFGCRTHINAFTKFCQIPCWWRQKDHNIMYFWELFNLKFSFKKQQARKEQFHARTGKKLRMAHLIRFSISNFHSRNNHQKDHNIFVSPNIA